MLEPRRRHVRGFPRRSATAAVTIALSLGSVGCTTVHTGSAARHPDADSSGVNTALLDAGEFPTTPRKPFGLADSVQAGQHLEAQRMAEVVLLPIEIDPMLTQQSAAGPFTDTGFTIDAYLPGTANVEVAEAVRAHKAIAGFATEANAVEFGKFNVLKSLVVRFTDTATAEAAAADMAEHSEREPGNHTPARRAHALPGHPEVQAFLGGRPALVELCAYTVHGPYLLVQVVTAVSTDEAERLVIATVDKQRPALDGFTATPPDQLAALPRDPTGLLARALPPADSSAETDRVGAYGPHGALHFSRHPAADQKLFAEAGVTELARTLTTIYAARDAEAATRVTDSLVDQITADAESNLTPDTPPAGMPRGRCFKPQDNAPISVKPRCLAPAGRYVIDATTTSAPEVRHMLAAQYLMLTAP